MKLTRRAIQVSKIADGAFDITFADMGAFGNLMQHNTNAIAGAGCGGNGESGFTGIVIDIVASTLF